MVRFFPNTLEPKDFDNVDTYYENIIHSCVTQAVHELQHSKNFSIYTGTGGVAYTLFTLQNANIHILKTQYQLALEIIDSGLESITQVGSFLASRSGLLALKVVLLHKLGKPFQKEFDEFCNVDISILQNELLKGKAGYLYCVQFIRKNVHIKMDSVVLKCIDEIFKSRDSSVDYLRWEWKRKYYLGAAHGQAGVLTVLMSCDELTIEQKDLIRGSVDFILTQSNSENSFPAHYGQPGDCDRVHFCHGAPGICLMLLKAFRFFNDQKYLEKAEILSNLIWKKGLLTKSKSLCHGIAGNGFVFIALYEATGKKIYLNKARAFMHFIQSTKDIQMARIPDNPASLFEGKLGIALFALALYEVNGDFPCFTDI